MNANRFNILVSLFAFFLSACQSGGTSSEGQEVVDVPVYQIDMSANPDLGADISPALDAKVETPDGALVDLGADVVKLPRDMGTSDGQSPDARILDAGEADGSTPDALESDLAQADAREADGVIPDGEVPDGPADALTPDAAADGPPLIDVSHTQCEPAEVEQGRVCFDGCDNDGDGILDTLDISCHGSCDGNNPFCQGDQICNVLTERCEAPIPIGEQFPDPGLCSDFPPEHPCYEQCGRLFLSGQSCFWLGGRSIAVVDGDVDSIQDELVVPGSPVDNCPAWYNPDQVDVDGNGVGDPCDLPEEQQVDDDYDLIPGLFDNCPYVFNPWQLDDDGDGIGDECTGMPPEGCGDGLDSTEDQWNSDTHWCEYLARESQWFFWTHLCQEDDTGACAVTPQCPAPAEWETLVVYNGWFCANYLDTDGDNVPELVEGLLGQYLDPPFVDNCLEVANPDQADSDGDGIGDACEEPPAAE